ncbi:MAG: efflux RND transporter permease subunit [Steroidobacteraceae bacterium]
MNFVTWSIRNPVPVAVLFFFLTIAGLLSFSRLGIQERPEIDFPTVIATITYPGVAPSQLESEVTRKVEDSISTVTGIEHMRSNVSDGVSTTIVEFDLDRDMADALDDVRDAVTRIRNDLPADANEPVVSRVTTAGLPILAYSVAADGMSATELSWFIDQTVRRELIAVTGVGAVSRVGGVSREIRVDLDPDRMRALGATAADVSRRLRQTQTQLPGGEGRIGGLEQTMRAEATMATADDLAAMPITLSDRRSVRLDAIAAVRDQAAEQRQMATLDGREVIGFEVTRAFGSSSLDTAYAVRDAVAKMRTAYPNMRFVEVNSTVENIEESYHSSMEMLVEGGLLAVAVVWLFLRDLRATLISALALPLSMVPTFWVMHMMGITLNILTTLALSLVIGILVDDAIVEVENIVRHLRDGKKPREAAMEAAIEIGLAVIATTLTICAVFLPVAFMGGVPGRFFRPFGLTVVVAVLFSLLVARMLTPLLAAYWLQPQHEAPRESRFNRWYRDQVARVLRHRGRTVVASTLLFVGAIMLGRFLPADFAPAHDIDLARLAVELPTGSRLQDTRGVVEEVRGRLTKLPDVVSVYAVIGTASSMGFVSVGNTDVRKATLWIRIRPRGEREGTLSDFQRRAARQLADIPGARMNFMTDFGSGMQLELVSESGPALRATATQLEREMKTIPGLGTVTSSASLLKPEVLIRPDPRRAAALGVTTEDIASVVRVATAGDFDASLPKFNLPDRQIPIRVRLADDTRSDLDRIALLSVPGRDGPVPLVNVADVRLDSGPAVIERLDRSRSVTINAELYGQPLGPALAAVSRLPVMQALPPSVRRVDTGTAQFMRELFQGFFLAMAIGILAIYAVLVLLFKEFLQPLTILSALPPSAGGAIVSLLIGGYGLSISSLIAMVLLMGIVTKNSILLVEYAEKAKRTGLDRDAAMLDACDKRVRPIVMTSIAMGAGMLPVALGLSGDPTFRAPMGVAVMGGVIASTALSLFVVPVVFTCIDDLQGFLVRRFARRQSRPAAGPTSAPE